MNEEKLPRVELDFTIVDQYGNANHICKNQKLYEELEGDGLKTYREAFRLLLVQVGYTFLEGKEIQFTEKED